MSSERWSDEGPTKKVEIPWGIKRSMPRKAVKLYEEARSRFERGDLDGAERNAKLALTFESDYPEATLLVAKVAHERKASEAKSLPVHRGARYLYLEAVETLDKGEVELAVALFERALELSKEAMICDRLGMLLHETSKQQRRAEKLLQRAVALAPEEPRYSKNLAAVLGKAAARDMSVTDAKAKQRTRPGWLFGN